MSMDDPTTAGFRCSECGQHTNMLVNTRCLACATKVTPVRGSWICARCRASNAPHVDRCRCHPDITISFKDSDCCGPGTPRHDDLLGRAMGMNIMPRRGV